MVNNKFFKINEKSNAQEKAFNSLSPRKSYGKAINLQILNEIHQKEKNLINAQRHSIFKSCDYSNFNSEDFIKEYIKKCEANSEKKKMLIEEKFSPLITEETFNTFIQYFYERKMLKSPSVMKYFQGKNIEVILNNIGKYIFLNTFSPKEQNFASYEYLSKIHQHLNIENQDFDTYKGLFFISMREKGFPEEEIQKFAVRIEHYRPHIVRPMKFDEISCRNESFNAFLMRLVKTVKDNGMLTYLFEKTSNEDLAIKFKKLFNFLSLGYDYFDFHHHKHEFIEFLFGKQDFNWQQCFELKNIIRNELMDIKSLSFHEDFKIFDCQLHNLHKFIMLEPNPYDVESSLDPHLLVSLFCHSLNNEKSLNKIFGGWSIHRLQDHCKFMVEYLIQSKQNPYKLTDLTPAHSACYISEKDFDTVMAKFSTCLMKMKTKKHEFHKMNLHFERARRFISREPQTIEKIPDFTHCIDHFVENIYVYMFGNPNTKHFFKNSDLSYIKYKQKNFFLKLLRNELDHVDLVDLQAIHSKMNIKPLHFQLFLKFSQESLEEIHLNPKIMEFVLEKIQGLSDYICLEKE